MEIPQQLRAHRERLGLSQEEVARAIFVSRQTMSNWETGKTYPDIQSLLLLSNLYGTSIDELVKGDVRTMEGSIERESRKLRRLGWAMGVCLVGMLVSASLAIILRDVGVESPLGMSRLSLAALIVAGALAAGALAAAFWAEAVKRRNDLVTYREIVAFERGLPVEEVRRQDALGRRHPALSVVLKAAAAASAALVLLIVLQVVAKTIRDLVLLG
ncbi:MAG: helix-turn-helix transcriptional regulator [Eggerthellaceae bacterium]|nr:helix-turn-helix transcriptional regulator [Eggerthellaceae bacterium]